jgi:hypothetical protein
MQSHNASRSYGSMLGAEYIWVIAVVVDRALAIVTFKAVLAKFKGLALIALA